PDRARVDYWQDRIAQGDKVPPLKVREANGQAQIEDGKHRFAAYLREGIDDIPVEVERPKIKVNNYQEPKVRVNNYQNAAEFKGTQGRTPDGRFSNIEKNPEAGFVKAPDIMDTKLGQTLYPIKNQDQATQASFKEWNRKLLSGKEAANLEV